jgi:hypothetical protein
VLEEINDRRDFEMHVEEMFVHMHAIPVHYTPEGVLPTPPIKWKKIEITWARMLSEM